MLSLSIAAAALLLTSLAMAAPAFAGLRGAMQKFSDCAEGYRLECVYSTTTGGEFVLGKGQVPIVNPVIIQGGIGGGGKLFPAADGNTLSKTPEPVPGGLVGIELLGNFTSVNAIAELAGQAYITGEAILPIKARLENLALGGNCYIGSEAEPISLDLNFAKGMQATYQYHTILTVKGTLEDHTFEAPGANGCTLLPLVGDLAVNVKEGLPSASGNAAVMIGTTEEAPHRIVDAVKPLPDFGRCAKVTPEVFGKELKYHGGYIDSKCEITAFELNQKYEWTAGPGAAPKFSGGSGVVKLQSTTGASNIKCAASTNSGEYSGPKTESLGITLTGCETGPAGHVSPCQSSGAASGEVRSANLQGSLDFIKETGNLEYEPKSVVGLELKAASGTELFSFECGGTTYSISGGQVGAISPSDTMSSALKLTDKEVTGVPQYSKFEEGTPTTLTFSKNGGAAEAGAIQIAQSQAGEEKIDVKGDVR